MGTLDSSRCYWTDCSQLTPIYSCLLTMAPTLGYWELRGLAAPIRYMLHHLEVEFVDRQYGFGTPPNLSKDEWEKDKDSLGLEFPNLPYFIDDYGLKITESSAIMAHLGRKHGLAGSCEKDYIRIDVAKGILGDIGMQFAKMCYGDFESMKGPFIAGLPAMLQKLSDLLHERCYILDDKICYMDFVLLELLERLTLLVPDCLAKYPNLTAFHTKILALPGVDKYRKSENFQKIKTRFNGPFAKFGHGLESYP